MVNKLNKCCKDRKLQQEDLWINFFLCILSEKICQLNYAKFENKWIGKRLTVKTETAYQDRSNAVIF